MPTWTRYVAQGVGGFVCLVVFIWLVNKIDGWMTPTPVDPVAQAHEAQLKGLNESLTSVKEERDEFKDELQDLRSKIETELERARQKGEQEVKDEREAVKKEREKVTQESVKLAEEQGKFAQEKTTLDQEKKSHEEAKKRFSSEVKQKIERLERVKDDRVEEERSRLERELREEKQKLASMTRSSLAPEKLKEKYGLTTEDQSDVVSALQRRLNRGLSWRDTEDKFNDAIALLEEFLPPSERVVRSPSRVTEDTRGDSKKQEEVADKKPSESQQDDQPRRGWPWPDGFLERQRQEADARAQAARKRAGKIPILSPNFP